MTQQSLHLQQRSVERQQELGRLYRRVVLLGGAAVLVLMALLSTSS